MHSKKDFFTTTREEAAKLLGVSTRTLDRYTKRGKLRVKLSADRKILIHAKDLEKIAKHSLPEKTFAKRKTSSKGKTEPVAAEAVEVTTENVEEKVFRELYEEANKDLKQKQEKLEAASFRVGQLEAQLKNSVPLLEHKQKEEVMVGETSRLKEKLITAILKGWVFLGIAITATIVAGVFGFLAWNT
ncbi:helix-turn-helix domain-containing protein [Candidatus Gracilibacteria bacterium]|nr:helix-turn-helix domain-containing protein [Candidatus Gracilibacteria bacterium]